jgi:hypothetical protein
MNKKATTLLVLLLLIQGALGSLSISRELPARATPGENITVILRFSGSATGGVIIKESLPPGWSVLDSEPSGYFSGEEAMIKWVFPRGAPEKLTYTLRVPSTAQGEYVINGSWTTLAGQGEISPSMLLVEQVPEQGVTNKAAALALMGGALLLYLLRRRRG